MSKEYSKKELKNKLMHMMCVAFDIIQQDAKTMKELDIKVEEWKALPTSDRVKNGMECLKRMNILNYMLKPSYGLMRQFYPDAHQFIDACELNYNEAIKSGHFKECVCPACNSSSTFTPPAEDK